MPSTTPLGALPIPLDGDAVSNGALAIRNLATALDRKNKRKTADENVNNSAVLQNDDELFIALEANKTYEISGHLVFITTTSAIDAKVALTCPAGATITWSAIGMDPAVAAGNTGSGTWTGSVASGGTIPVGVSSAYTPVLISGTIAVGATAGNLQLQWAQNTATAANLTLKAGSNLKCEVIP